MTFPKWTSDLVGLPLVKTLRWHPIVCMMATVLSRLCLRLPHAGLPVPPPHCSFLPGQCLQCLPHPRGNSTILRSPWAFPALSDPELCCHDTAWCVPPACAALMTPHSHTLVCLLVRVCCPHCTVSPTSVTTHHRIPSDWHKGRRQDLLTFLALLAS